MSAYSCPDCLIDHAELADPCSACKRVAGTVKPRQQWSFNFYSNAPPGSVAEARAVGAFKQAMEEAFKHA